MDSPKVSIITRTRNRPVLLQRAVRSVLGQENPPEWEWIVVNDGGDPKVVEMVVAPAEGDTAERLRTLHLPESHGMEHASNAGIVISNGEYVAIHDDDDSWHPDFLAEMVGYLEDPARAGLGGAICHAIRIVEDIEGETITIRHQHGFNFQVEELRFWEVLKENPFPPISFLFRRSAYDAAGPFDETLPVLGDWEFNLRVLARFPIGVLPKPLANYHHRSQDTSPANANSITLQQDLHQTVENRLRNRWSRSNPFGFPPELFGHAARIAGGLHRMKTGIDRLAYETSGLDRPAPPQF